MAGAVLQLVEEQLTDVYHIKTNKQELEENITNDFTNNTVLMRRIVER